MIYYLVFDHEEKTIKRFVRKPNNGVIPGVRNRIKNSNVSVLRVDKDNRTASWLDDQGNDYRDTSYDDVIADLGEDLLSFNRGVGNSWTHKTPDDTP